jgi:cell envelope opacity-associated protein A
VKRRNEPVATDTVFSDTPAVDSGVTAAQLFVGHESLVADVYGLKTDCRMTFENGEQ